MWAQLPLLEGAHRVTTTRTRQFAQVAVQQLVVGEGRIVVQRMHDRPLTSRLTILLDGGTLLVKSPDLTDPLLIEPGGGFLHYEEIPLKIEASAPSTVLSLVGVVAESGREVAETINSGLLRLGSSPLISGIAGFGLALLADRHPDSHLDGRALERMARVMVRELFVHAQGTALVPERPSDYDLAIEVIRRDAVQPDCTAAHIAAELNVSLRNLEREFQQRGETVRRAVRDARIQHAIDLLRDPTRSGLTVSQIATFSGFSSGSALARAMASAEYGTPKSYRA